MTTPATSPPPQTGENVSSERTTPSFWTTPAAKNPWFDSVLPNVLNALCLATGTWEAVQIERATPPNTYRTPVLVLWEMALVLGLLKEFLSLFGATLPSLWRWHFMPVTPSAFAPRPPLLDCLVKTICVAQMMHWAVLAVGAVTGLCDWNSFGSIWPDFAISCWVWLFSGACFVVGLHNALTKDRCPSFGLPEFFLVEEILRSSFLHRQRWARGTRLPLRTNALQHVTFLTDWPSSAAGELSERECVICLERDLELGGTVDTFSEDDDASESSETSSPENDEPVLTTSDESSVDPLAKIAVPPCLHPFHTSCLLRWMQENPSCPICRAPID